MKAVKEFIKRIETEVFISHMVQMKVAPIARHEACKPPLYPTWFRWKKVGPNAWLGRFCLYIPHGSDESVHCNASSNPSASFISHMVQMKVSDLNTPACLVEIFISHMVQMKAINRSTNIIGNIAFISHMVQMKGIAVINSCL